MLAPSGLELENISFSSLVTTPSTTPKKHCRRLAKILARRHGFTSTVLFSISPSDGTIDPREKRNIPGLEALRTADLLVLFIREVVLEQYHSRLGRRLWAPRSRGEMGGASWRARKTEHREIFAPGAEASPIPRGIKDGEIWVPTETHEERLPLPATCRPLLLGQVLSWVGPDSDPVPGKLNNPMMPVAWTNKYSTASGKQARVFTTTMGSADDLETKSLRRLLVNATHWALGMESPIPEKANVAFTQQYLSHSFLSEVYTAGVKPSDLATGVNDR
jgi:hypothetical protein